MLFKSALVTQASGSLGGLTASRNAGGMYLRARAIPVNPNSNRQQVMRMYMDQTVTYWTETLTEAERNSWRNYAANVPVVNRIGDNVFLSGQQHWIRSGVPWLLAGKALSAIATAPVMFDTGDPGTLALANPVTSTQTITTTIGGTPGWAGDADGHLFTFMGLPQNPAVRFYKGPFRFVEATPGNATPIVVAQVDPNDANPPIPFLEGQRVFIRVRAQYPDGRLTQAFIFDKISVT